MWGGQKIFPYEREGSVLIVKPGGDSLSVQERQIKKEIDVIHNLVDQKDCDHLIVDLSGAPYFGSIVIGAVMAICGKMRNKEGKAALCNATEGVYDAIQIMKLDAAVPYFPTREEALAFVQEK
ncbi:MAG: STAS domain-containing protein [Planctomycetaceae bacterium]|nr:STAS domain-containing protein [Planctomycetaceae bacterium]